MLNATADSDYRSFFFVFKFPHYYCVKLKLFWFIKHLIVVASFKNLLLSLSRLL